MVKLIFEISILGGRPHVVAELEEHGDIADELHIMSVAHATVIAINVRKSAAHNAAKFLRDLVANKIPNVTPKQQMVASCEYALGLALEWFIDNKLPHYPGVSEMYRQAGAGQEGFPV